MENIGHFNHSRKLLICYIKIQANNMDLYEVKMETLQIKKN